MAVRCLRGTWHLAAIRPAGKTVWALPKGLVGRGEDPAATAVREVAEETGVDATLVEKLGDVRYVYTWKGERVFKIVSFFLLRYRSGSIRNHDHEVDSAEWVPLEEAPSLLDYRGDREMAAAALSRWPGPR